MCVCVCIAVHPGAQQVPVNDKGEEILGRDFHCKAGQSPDTSSTKGSVLVMGTRKIAWGGLRPSGW